MDGGCMHLRVWMEWAAAAAAATAAAAAKEDKNYKSSALEDTRKICN